MGTPNVPANNPIKKPAFMSLLKNPPAKAPIEAIPINVKGKKYVNNGFFNKYVKNVMKYVNNEASRTPPIILRAFLLISSMKPSLPSLTLTI